MTSLLPFRHPSVQTVGREARKGIPDNQERSQCLLFQSIDLCSHTTKATQWLRSAAAWLDRSLESTDNSKTGDTTFTVALAAEGVSLHPPIKIEGSGD